MWGLNGNNFIRIANRRRLLIKQAPVQFPLLAPLLLLSEILSHKQKLFARVGGHIPIRQPQLCQLLLRCARHFPVHRPLSMYYLVMGKYKYKIFRIVIYHTERKHPVPSLAVKRVRPYIFQIVVHPAHIPLQVKAKATFLYFAGNHRPGG